jgi:PST family polysaccharide transporter
VGEIRDRLVTGAKHTIFANVILTGAAAVQFIAVARMLGKEDYGVFRILVNMTQVGSLLAIAGLQGAMVKYVAEFADSKEDLQKVVSNCLALNVISAVIICGLFAALSGVIALRGYQEPRLTVLIIISSATMFVIVVFGQFRSIIQGFQQIPLYAKLVMLQGLAMLGGVVILTWLFGLTGIALGILAGSVVQAVASVPLGLRALKQHGISFRLSLDRATAKKMLNFGIPSLLAGFVIIPAYLYGNSMLKWYHGFGEVGIFGVANSVSRLMLLIPAAVGIATVPLISELDSKNPIRAIGVLVKTLRIVSLVLLPFVVLVSMLSHWFVPLLFGIQYSQAVFPLQLMAIVVYIMSVGTVLGSYLTGTGRMWQALGLNFAWCTIFIVLAYLLSKPGGANGLAWAYLYSNIVSLLLFITYFWAHLKISLKSCLAPVLLTGAFGALALMAGKSIGPGYIKIIIAILLCCGGVAAAYAIAGKQEKELLYDQLAKVFLRRPKR